MASKKRYDKQLDREKADNSRDNTRKQKTGRRDNKLDPRRIGRE